MILIETGMIQLTEPPQHERKWWCDCGHAHTHICDVADAIRESVWRMTGLSLDVSEFTILPFLQEFNFLCPVATLAHVST
jgi:hypothetical protein